MSVACLGPTLEGVERGLGPRRRPVPRFTYRLIVDYITCVYYICVKYSSSVDRLGPTLELKLLLDPRVESENFAHVANFMGYLPKNRVLKPTVLPTVGRRGLGGVLRNIRS